MVTIFAFKPPFTEVIFSALRAQNHVRYLLKSHVGLLSQFELRPFGVEIRNLHPLNQQMTILCPSSIPHLWFQQSLLRAHGCRLAVQRIINQGPHTTPGINRLRKYRKGFGELLPFVLAAFWKPKVPLGSGIVSEEQCHASSQTWVVLRFSHQGRMLKTQPNGPHLPKLSLIICILKKHAFYANSCWTRRAF